MFNESKADPDNGEQTPYDYLVKLVLIGDSGVGKSNILTRFVANEFSFDSKSTVGITFSSKSFVIDDRVIQAQVWDTAGQERYHALTTAFYRGAAGILLVFDITDRPSFINLTRWLQELLDHNNNNSMLIMLVGNKRDLEANRQVSTEEAIEFARQHRMFFLETSALNSSNITTAFHTLIENIYIRTLLPLRQSGDAHPHSQHPAAQSHLAPHEINAEYSRLNGEAESWSESDVAIVISPTVDVDQQADDAKPKSCPACEIM